MTVATRTPSMAVQDAGPVAFHDDIPRRGRREYADGTIAPVLLTDFDVTAYTVSVEGRIAVDTAAIGRDTADVDASWLADLRRDLTFLLHVESTALTETRTMYSSWTANEARITAFLGSWLWERFWWARALREVRDALPESAADRASRVPLLSRLRHQYIERALPIVGPGWTFVAGENVTAGHMARMAIQEGSLQAAHEALRRRLPMSSFTELRRVLTEIIGRRELSLDFFRQEAIARITRSRAEARTARAVLAVGGDPLRPAGGWVPHEDHARASIFRTATDRGALRMAREEITRLLPLPRRARGGV